MEISLLKWSFFSRFPLREGFRFHLNFQTINKSFEQVLVGVCKGWNYFVMWTYHDISTKLLSHFGCFWGCWLRIGGLLGHILIFIFIDNICFFLIFSHPGAAQTFKHFSRKNSAVHRWPFCDHRDVQDTKPKVLEGSIWFSIHRQQWLPFGTSDPCYMKDMKGADIFIYIYTNNSV